MAVENENKSVEQDDVDALLAAAAEELEAVKKDAVDKDAAVGEGEDTDSAPNVETVLDEADDALTEVKDEVGSDAVAEGENSESENIDDILASLSDQMEELNDVTGPVDEKEVGVENDGSDSAVDSAVEEEDSIDDVLAAMADEVDALNGNSDGSSETDEAATVREEPAEQGGSSDSAEAGEEPAVDDIMASLEGELSALNEGDDGAVEGDGTQAVTETEGMANTAEPEAAVADNSQAPASGGGENDEINAMLEAAFNELVEEDRENAAGPQDHFEQEMQKDGDVGEVAVEDSAQENEPGADSESDSVTDIDSLLAEAEAGMREDAAGEIDEDAGSEAVIDSVDDAAEEETLQAEAESSADLDSLLADADVQEEKDEGAQADFGGDDNVEAVGEAGIKDEAESADDDAEPESEAAFATATNLDKDTDAGISDAEKAVMDELTGNDEPQDQEQPRRQIENHGHFSMPERMVIRGMEMSNKPFEKIVPETAKNIIGMVAVVTVMMTMVAAAVFLLMK